MKKFVPICEACWIKENSSWEPESVDEKGNIRLRLKGVATPPKISRGTVENCSDCESLTIAGILKVSGSEVVYGVDGSADYSDYTGFDAGAQPEDEEEEY